MSQSDGVSGVAQNSKSKTPAKIACDNCRRSHKKCDAKKPSCSSCLEHGLECVYLAPKKRGPVRGLNQQLRAQVTVLKKEVERLRAGAVGDSKFTPESVHDFDDATQSTSSTSAATDAVYSSPIVGSLIDVYFNYVAGSYPLADRAMLERALQSRQRGETSSHVFLLHALLAMCAQRVGSLEYAADFIQRARKDAGLFFDKIAYEVGCAFTAMCEYYIGEGKFPLASLYNQICHGICEQLGATNTNLYKSYLHSQSIVCEKNEDRIRYLLLLETNYIDENAKYGLSEKALVYALRVIAELQQENSSHDFVALLSTLQQAEQKIPTSNNGYDTCALTAKISISAVSAEVYKQAGLGFGALEWANRATELTKLPSFAYCSPVVFPALRYAIQIHLERNSVSELWQDYKALESLSKKYKLVAEFKHALKNILQQNPLLEQMLLREEQQQQMTVNMNMLMRQPPTNSSNTPSTLLGVNLDNIGFNLGAIGNMASLNNAAATNIALDSIGLANMSSTAAAAAAAAMGLGNTGLDLNAMNINMGMLNSSTKDASSSSVASSGNDSSNGIHMPSLNTWAGIDVNSLSSLATMNTNTISATNNLANYDNRSSEKTASGHRSHDNLGPTTNTDGSTVEEDTQHRSKRRRMSDVEDSATEGLGNTLPSFSIPGTFANMLAQITNNTNLNTRSNNE